MARCSSCRNGFHGVCAGGSCDCTTCDKARKMSKYDLEVLGRQSYEEGVKIAKRRGLHF